VAKNVKHLLASHALVPLEKIADRCACLEILKQCRHRQARAFKYERAADPSWHSLHRLTLCPIEHVKKLNDPLRR